MTMSCLVPFKRMDITENGNIHLCCSGWMPKSIGNILTDDLLTLWNSQKAWKIRTDCRNGNFEHCFQCPLIPGPAGSVQSLLPELPLTKRIDLLNLAYDPTCNLSCLSCRRTPRTPLESSNPYQAITIHNRLLSSGILFKVNRLCVAGCGDPFASKLYQNLLQNLSPSKYPNLKIYLHTNGLLFEPNNWDKLGESKNMVTQVEVSIDAATSDTYKLNRGGNWLKLQNNLKFIKELHQINDIQFAFVVQSNNFREMPLFLEWSKEFNPNRLYFLKLMDWKTFSPHDYQKRAIHLPTNFLHQEFLSVIRNIDNIRKKLITPTVDLSNFHQLL